MQQGMSGRPLNSSQFLDRNAYLTAGFDLLARHGCHALTIMNLGEQLGVTRGSFYHHFTDLTEFTDALVDVWERSAMRMLDVIGELTDVAARFEATARYTLHEIPHEVEAGLRAWAYANPVAEAALTRVDVARQQNYSASVALFNDDPERCESLGHLGLELLIGLQQTKPIDPDMFLRVGLEWTRRNVGLKVDVLRLPDGSVGVRITPPEKAPAT